MLRFKCMWNVLKNTDFSSNALLRKFSVSHVTQTHEGLTKTVQKDGVRRIVMCNPKTRNALSLQMLEALRSDLTYHSEDSELRCVVLSGEGPVFSAGHNLKELTSAEGQKYHEKVFDVCTKLMSSIINLPVPVIGQVQGLAAAAGCQLVAMCDIVIASENAKFSTPGANFGIFCSTPGVAVARAVPRKVATHMLFTGLPIDSEEALRAGLVSKVVPEDQLELETEKVVKSILMKSRCVVALGKKFFYKQIQQDITTAYKLGEAVMVENLALIDAQEGIKSFIEKKKPNWIHVMDRAH